MGSDPSSAPNPEPADPPAAPAASKSKSVPKPKSPSKPKPARAPAIPDLAKQLSEEQDADVLFYNGPINRRIYIQLARGCDGRRRRKNVLFLLTTWGGDPDAAYRIARCLQNKYKKFRLCVSSQCKSAGTIIALGAHELAMSDRGEVGPLDVQMSKKDDLLQRQSGQTVGDALNALAVRAFAAFEHFFLNVYQKGQGAITVQTAAQIATEMASGLFAPLYRQVDPLHVGETARAMSIAREYGERLLARGENIKKGALEELITEYPSHSFAIDSEEAGKLFTKVHEPTVAESALVDLLGDLAAFPSNDSDREIVFLSDLKPAGTTT